MNYIKTDKILQTVNACYTMLGYQNEHSVNLDTLEVPIDGYMTTFNILEKYDKLQDVNTHELVSNNKRWDGI